ncbi:MAG: PilZ domain-containing protein [Candidatus Methylomirabilales bacterium]
MNKDLGRVSRNDSEEIRLTLREVRGELCLELRVYTRSAHHGGMPVPDPEAIVVPIRVLPDLCRVLQQSHDRLVKEGLAAPPSRPTIVTMQPTEPPTLCLGDLQAATPNTRSELGTSVTLPVECYLLKTSSDTWPSKPLPGHVAGEIRNVSGGGAQVWLPEQFPISTHLAILMRIGEITFRAQAEVVGTAPHPKDGHYSHDLQWLSLSPQAEAALSKLVAGPQ